MNMQAFAAILRQIQYMCMDNDAEHLAIVASEIFRLSHSLLEYAGFNICYCEYPSKIASVGMKRQLCMPLPNRPAHSLEYNDQGHHPMESSSTREGDHGTALVKRTPTAQTTSTRDPFALQSLKSKEYCTYWIFRGECGYMEQGCCYKHEIPHDKETRDSIGLRGIPPWFKRSPHWGPWLQQLGPADRLAVMRSDQDKPALLGQPSGRASDPRATDTNWRGNGMEMTKPKGRGKAGPRMLDLLDRLGPRLERSNKGTLATDISSRQG